jgi:hypothetical protein
MSTLTITLRVHSVNQLPDADSDVLIFDGADSEGQLGAYVGHDKDGPQWVNAQGEAVQGVLYWADMPRLPLLMMETA